MLDAPLTTGPVTDIAGRVGGAVGAGRSSHATASITTVRESRTRSEEHTSELQSQSNLVCRLLLEKKKNTNRPPSPANSAEANPEFRCQPRLETQRVARHPTQPTPHLCGRSARQYAHPVRSQPRRH